MEKILEQIDGIIGEAFHLPKSDETDRLLADLEDLRKMIASQQSFAPDAPPPPHVCDFSNSLHCPVCGVAAF